MGLYVRRRYTFVTKTSFTDAEKKDNTGKSKSRNTALSYMWVRSWNMEMKLYGGMIDGTL